MTMKDEYHLLGIKTNKISKFLNEGCLAPFKETTLTICASNECNIVKGKF